MGSTGWIALDVLPAGDNAFAYWSPDGAHLLVVSPSFRGNRTAALVTADGSPIRSYDGVDYAIWLDESKFLIVSYGEGTGDRPNNARLGTVDAPGLTGVDVPKGTALSNNHGSGAFFTSDFEYTNDCGFGCPVYNFRVWSDGATTDAHEGEPVA